jgi:hypothetical protein
MISAAAQGLVLSWWDRHGATCHGETPATHGPC